MRLTMSADPDPTPKRKRKTRAEREAERQAEAAANAAKPIDPLIWIVLGVALLFVVRRIRQAHDLPLTVPVWGALMLAAGGVGNLIDCFYRDGAVVDFMNAGIGSLRTGIFNVADVQIMAGAVLLAFAQEVRKGDETQTPDVPPESRAG